MVLTITTAISVPDGDSRLLGGAIAELFGHPVNVWAESLTDQLLVSLVQRNLGQAARYEEVTTEVIEEAVRKQHKDGEDWSNINIPNVMKSIGETIADIYIETQTSTDAEGNEVVTEITTVKNPWVEESENSEGSPYSPGVDYQGNAMNANYTLGQMMIDYTRGANSGAALLTDAKIIEVYNTTVEGSEEDNPFVDMDVFMEAIQVEITASKSGTYADKDATEAIDTSRYITYGDYVIARGTPIPAGYLFIGTWLMDAQAVTSTFYRKAVESMVNDDQQVMLYKSELSGSYWKDIYEATGLESILPLAGNVEEASLAGYYISIVVGSDGIPHWAKTGEEADIFSMVNPYELEQLPELRPLRMLLDAGIVSAADSGSKLYTYWRLRHFFDYDGDYTRNDIMKRDAEYIIDLCGRSGIWFHAGRPVYGFYTSSDASYWSYERSGRGFLESIIQWAESYPNQRVDYKWGAGDSGGWLGSLTWLTPALNVGIMVDGPVCLRNEVAWKNEVNAMGGLSAFSDRVANFQYLWRHYSCVRDDVTDEADQRLSNVNGLYRQIRTSGNTEDIELADKVMEIAEKLDATRRAEVYYNLVENERCNYVIGPPLNFLYQQVSYGETGIGLNYQMMLNTSEDFSPESSIVGAVENAVQECSAAQYKYQAMGISEGTTILSTTEYSLTMDVINRSGEGPVAIRSDLRSLIDLDNIANNVIVHKSRELNFLNDTLLPTADVKFQQYVHASVGDTYRRAAADPNTGEETLNEILLDQKAGVSGVAAELQRFIRARAMRIPTDSAIEFVNERINWAEAQRIGISTDNFGSYAEEALDDHIQWLKDLLSTLKEGGSLDEDETDWKTIKAGLELDLLTALDNNDLEEAEELSRHIDEVEDRILEAEAANRQVMGDPTASAADKANASDPNSPAGVAEKILNDTLAQIAEGDYDIEINLSVLEELGSPDISKVVASLTSHGAPLTVINAAKKAAENAGASSFNERLDEIEADDDNGGGAGGGGNGTDDNGDGNGTGGNGNGSNGTGDNGTGNNNNNGGSGTGNNGNNTGNNGSNNNNGDSGNNGNGTGNNNGSNNNNGDNGNNGNGTGNNGSNNNNGSNGNNNNGSNNNNGTNGNNGNNTGNNDSNNNNGNGTGNNGTGNNGNNTGNNGSDNNNGNNSSNNNNGNNGSNNNNGNGTGSNGTGNNGNNTGNNGSGNNNGNNGANNNNGNGTGSNGTGNNGNNTGNNGSGNNNGSGTGNNGNGTGNNGSDTGNDGNGTGNNGNGTGNNGTGTGNNGNGTGNNGTGTGNNGNGTGNNGNGTGNNGNGTVNNGNGTGNNGNGTGNNGNGTGNNGTGTGNNGNGTGNNGTGTGNNGTSTGNNGNGTGNNGSGTENNGSGTGNNGSGTGNNGNGTGNNGNGTGTGNNGNGTGNNGSGTGNNGNGTGNNGNGTGNNGTGTGNDGNGTGNNGSGTGNNGNGTGNNGNGTGNNGNGTDNNGNGTGNNGSGTGNNGSGTGNNGNGSGNNGNGTGTGNNNGGTGNGDGNGSGEVVQNVAGDPITGPGTGLKQRDFERAIQEAFQNDFDSLSPENKAAVIVALTQFAKARDDRRAYNYMLDELDEMIRIKSPFIYKQYLADQTKEYVSLGAVSRCRKYTRFRLVKNQLNEATMSQIAGGSASYVFTIGNTSVQKNNGTTDIMDFPAVTQADESLYGSKTAQYPYITEEAAGKYLYNTCVYIPGTEWAILITPQTDKKVAEFLDLLDIYADDRITQ